jgi:RecB family exonuclease
VRQVLGITPIAQPTDAVTPSEIGNAWHKVVECFHHSRGLGADIADDETVFTQSIDKILRDKCAENPRYWAVKPLFASYQSAFVHWWRAREAQGWQHKRSEYSPEIRPLQTIMDEAQNPVHELQWTGRIDQVDENAEGALALIDYKTNGLSKHKKQVANDEDVQLAFYINLMTQSQNATIVDALYVGVEKDASKTSPQVSIGTFDELTAKAQALRSQVNQIFAAMCAGEPLRAFGALGELGACKYCDYRAVCRKDYVLSSNVGEGVEEAQ